MIEGFEEHTQALTDYERDILLPVIVKGLNRKIGEDNSITSKEIIRKLTDLGYKISGARLRKIVNHIRIKGLIKCLMASSRGYWIEDDPQKLMTYIISLEQRAESIQNVAESLKAQLYYNT